MPRLCKRRRLAPPAQYLCPADSSRETPHGGLIRQAAGANPPLPMLATSHRSALPSRAAGPNAAKPLHSPRRAGTGRAACVTTAVGRLPDAAVPAPRASPPSCRRADGPIRQSAPSRGVTDSNSSLHRRRSVASLTETKSDSSSPAASWHRCQVDATASAGTHDASLSSRTAGTGTHQSRRD